MATKRTPLLNSLWTNALRLYVLTCILLFGFGADWDITTAYLHPKVGAVGGAGIAWSDSAAAILNPGLIGRQSKWGVSYFQASLEQELVNQHIQWTLPIGSITHSFSYYRQGLSGIPITELIDQRIRQNGSFSASISQFRWAAGTTWEDILFMRRLGLGGSMGFQQYDFAAGNATFYQIGLHAQPTAYDFLGLGVVMDMTEGQGTLRAGVSSHVNPLDLLIDWDGKAFRAGAQYAMNEMWQFRGGIESRFLTLGAGLNYDQLVGILPQNLAFSIDLATQIPLDPAYSICTYAGITIQEQDHLRIPTIEDYPRVTNKGTATVQGWAEPASTVWIQVNEQERIRTRSNENGQWSANTPLMMGSNKVTAWASDIRRERPSLAGKPVQILQDDSLPEISLTAWVNEENVKFNIASSKILGDDPQIRTDKMSSQKVARLAGKYNGTISRSDIGHEWTIEVRDLANNPASLVLNEPIMTLLSPKEMINTTHEDKFFLNGNGYRYSELTLFNDSTEERIPIKLQKIGQFQQYTSLIIGKNRFRLVDARKDAEIIYPFTVIRTHAYRDTKNEDFNQMATLGILDPTPLLKPALPTTKGAALLWLARLKEVRIENVDSDSPAWWKAVNQLALKEHWIEKIDDDRVLKRKEAMLLMTRVLGIDVFDILTDTTHARNISSQNPDAKLVTWFIEHGMMPAGNTNLNEPVQRAEFANWLRRTDVGVYRISKYFETN